MKYSEATAAGVGLEALTRANSSAVMRDIIHLHALPYIDHEPSVLDLTFGQGRFWKWAWQDVLAGLTTNDVNPDTGADFNYDLRHIDEKHFDNFDIVVADPPFTNSGSNSSQGAMYAAYGTDRHGAHGPKDERAVLDILAGCIVTATKLANHLVVIKTQDTIDKLRYHPNGALAEMELHGTEGWELVDVRFQRGHRMPQPKAQRQRVKRGGDWKRDDQGEPIMFERNFRSFQGRPSVWLIARRLVT